MKRVAFIPARSGSTRVHDKNILDLGGHPLLARAVTSALNSGVFDEVLCITDSKAYAEISESYGAKVLGLRPASTALSSSRDVEWLTWILDVGISLGRKWELFSILRPTSPFRRAHHIQLALRTFLDSQPCDSLRSVRKVSEHPGKMWSLSDSQMLPLLPFRFDGQPWHSSPTQSLPQLFVQDASIEIAWVKTFRNYGTISGTRIVPFVNEGYQSLDINEHADFEFAQYLFKNGMAELEPIFNM